MDRLDDELRALETLSKAELRDRWAKLTGHAVPKGQCRAAAAGAIVERADARRRDRRGRRNPLERAGVAQPERGRPRHHRHSLVGPVFFGLKQEVAA